MRYRLTCLRGRRVLSALVLCAILFAFASSAARPSGKAPAAAAQAYDEITFAVIGDFGSGDANEQDVANLVKSWCLDFIITVGDNNYPCGEAATLAANVDRYYGGYVGKSLDTNRFFPTLGNHDYGLSCAGKGCAKSSECAVKNPNDPCAGKDLATPQPYLDYFKLPGPNGRYYQFTNAGSSKKKSPVEFFALNSDCNEPDGITSGSVQGQWLKARLAASTARWKIVYFHNPPYSSGAHRPTPEMQWPFREWGATAVITGHEHSYERIYKSDMDGKGGLPYIINGSGGVGLRPFPTDPSMKDADSKCRNDTDHGALKVVADSDSISFEFVSATNMGQKLDNCSISAKPGAKPAVLVTDPCSGRRRRCSK
jgi:tartrate-resistant acid phosphatase type 5